MRHFSRKTGEGIILHNKEHLSPDPFLVHINYLPNRNVVYFIMAENKDDASHKVKLNLQNFLKYFEQEHNTCLVDKIKTILGAMENNTIVKAVDKDRAIRVIEFDAPIF